MATFTAGTTALNMTTALAAFNAPVTMTNLLAMSPTGDHQLWQVGGGYYFIDCAVVQEGFNVSFTLNRFSLLNTNSPDGSGTFKWNVTGNLLSGSVSIDIVNSTISLNIMAGSTSLVSGTIILGGNPSGLHIASDAVFENVFLSGNDQIIGKAGNDVLTGGAGHDTMTGGGGSDKFMFDAKPIAANSDHITDFVHGTDKIQFDNADFKTIGAAGALDSGAFYIGTAAHDASDRIIYTKGTGSLYYDSDGNGSAAKVLIAVLDTHPTLSVSDLQVI